jgi:predicted nucleic acid-binding protein
MTFVIDASVAAKWLVDEPGSQDAADILATDRDLVAPELLLLELGSVLWQKTRRGEISAEHAAVAVERAPILFTRLFAVAPLVPDALDIAMALDHSVYDALYLALARSLSAPLVSDDQRLITKCHGTPFDALVTPLRRTSQPLVRSGKRSRPKKG